MGKYLDLINAVSDAAPGPTPEHRQRAEAAIVSRRSSTVIEATLRPAMPWPELIAAVKPQNPEFPLCPECHQRRYWISPKGKVVCGSRKCNGAVRFMLTAIAFHAVQ
jgi:hypothetical protein